MKRSIFALTLCTAFSVQTFAAQTVTVAFDKSRSNPLLSDPAFAVSAAEYVAQKIKPLKEGDLVRIKSFGSRTDGSNLYEQEIPITRHMRAKNVADAVKNYILGLPAQKDQGQSSTNIVAFLEFDRHFGCDDQGTVIVLTDALEASDYVDSNTLKSGKAHLPEPRNSLAGCTVIFYGLGAGLSGPEAEIIHDEWARFITSAGGQFIAEIK
ncbi:MAG: hypothetical protein ACRBB4_15665 [Neptuniibacter sp.]